MNRSICVGYLALALVLSGCGNGFAKRARALLGVYPKIHKISPAAGGISGNTTITIYGVDFNEESTAILDRTSCETVTFISSTEIQCVTKAHAEGPVEITVITDKTHYTAFNLFTFEPIPTVSTVDPTSGSPSAGNKIVINGTGFLSATGATIGGAACTDLKVIDATKLSCTVPSGSLGSVDVVVTNAEGPSTTTGVYTYSSTASISSITPTGGPMTGGTVVTIAGANFLPGANVKVGNVDCGSLTVTSSRAITCTTSASTVEGFVDVEVINADLQTATLPDGFFYEGAPTVASVSPTGGPAAGGTTLTLTGTRFLTATAATVGGAACTSFTVVNKTTATCVTPAHAVGAVDVAVTNGGGSGTLTGGFTYAPAPTVTTISPAFGGTAGGTIVAITGTNFDTTSVAKIGSTSCAAQNLDSATQITCTTPAAASGVVTATVTNGDGQSGTGGTFTYNAAPTVSGISPTSGPMSGGTTITISGTNLLSVNAVKVGGVACGTLSVTNDISLTCQTPVSTVAAAVDVEVTNVTGSVLSIGAFTYNPPPAFTSTISPDSGSNLGGTPIRINGTNFTSGGSVTVGGNPCVGLSLVSSSQLTCITSAHAAGLVNVVVTNGDGQSATATNAFTFEDNATIVSIAPVYGSPIGGATVTITGTNFLSASKVTLGGAVCAGMTVTSATTITCTTPAHAAGVVDLIVYNGNGPTTSSGAFTYADPQIASVSPAAGTTGGGTGITLTGTGFRSGATVTVGGVACTNVNVASETSITCDTPTNGAEGAVDVVVTNSAGGTDTETSGFTYEGAPTLTNVAPAVGPVAGGTTITLTGTRFLSTTGVTVDGVACGSLAVTSASSLTCVTAAHAAATVNVAVTNGHSGVTLNASFTYASPPTIGTISPSALATGGGTTITIDGTAFVATPTVTVDGLTCGSVNWVSATQITCTTPAHVPGATTIVVTNPDGQSATGTNAVTYEGAPTVGAVSPATGPQSGGTTVTITGTGFSSVTGVTIGGVTCGTLNIVSATSLTCVAPIGLASGAVDVSVTNSAGTGTLTSGFTYNGPPTFTATLNPNAGPTIGGTTIQITGTGLVSGATVAVDGTPCTSPNVVSSTSLTCVTPAHAAGSVDVVITNPDGQTGTANNAFIYEGNPTLTNVAPASGPVAGGTRLTLTGTGFLTATGVTVDGAACTAVNVSSATSLKCTTPAHAAGTFDVAVTNATTNTATMAGSFTYSAAPTVTAISPKGGAVGGGTAVTITGTNFDGGALTITIGGFACNGAAMVNASTATCTTTAGALGPQDVVVDVGGTPGTGVGLFTYEGAPTVTAVSPAAGPAAGGTTISITGTSFLSATGVTVDAVACTSFAKISATKVSCITPAGAAGARDVVVTNETGNQTLVGGFTYAAPPTVSAVSPGAGNTSGGTDVTITGTGFVAGATVTVGGATCSNVVVVSATEITCTTTGGSAGTATITVTNPDNQAGSAGGLFSYEAGPTLSSVSPSGGPLAGGTSLALTGTGFLSATNITVDGVACRSIKVVSATSAVCVTPAHAAGTVAVAITNAVGTATLLASYSYNAAPTIGTVLPVAGPIAGGTTITLTGTGYLAGAKVSVGGNECTNVQVPAPTTITCLTPTGTAGAKNVVVTNADKQSVSSTNAFTYEGVPTITLVTPAVGPSAGGTTITITGTNLTTTTSVKVDGLACTALVPGASVTCATPAHAAGVVDVVLTNAGGSVTSTAAFTYRAAPTVSAVSPTLGTTAGGTLLAVTGTNFFTGATITVGGTACTGPTVVSSTSITCTSPLKAAGTYDVVVTNSEGQLGTGTNLFTYEAAPTVGTVSPVGGPLTGGTTITVTGTSFLSTSSVKVGGVACTSLSITNATTLKCVTPSGSAGAKDVTVTNAHSTGTLAGGFTYRAAPAVTSVSPGVGRAAGGDSVTLTGTGFFTGATVLFDNSACTGIAVVSATSITCTTPAHAVGVVNVTVTNTDGQLGTGTGVYRYESSPTFGTITPSTGKAAGGSVVTIVGTNLLSATGVTIGGTACTNFTVVNATTVTCLTPAKAAGAYDVIVTNPTGSATGTNAFTYVASPTVASISPVFGKASGGTAVTITGTGFAAGATVKIGTVACANVVVASPTSITCDTGAASAGAYTVAVTAVTGDSGTSSGNLYTYETTPSIGSVSPSKGPSAGGLRITLTGTGFLSTTGVTINGVACTSLTLISATQVSCVTPALASGTYTVALTNAHAVGSKASGFSSVGLEGRTQFAASPTGDGRIFVWGGTGSGGIKADGGIYDPTSDSWKVVSTVNAPTARRKPIIEHVNGKLFIWGGLGSAGTVLNDGKIYNPANDTWTNVTTSGAPLGRWFAESVVYDDKYVLVVGGSSDTGYAQKGASFYNVVDDTWITPMGSDTLYASASAAFIGSCTGNSNNSDYAVVWGGRNIGQGIKTSGARTKMPPKATESWAVSGTTGFPLDKKSTSPEFVNAVVINRSVTEPKVFGGQKGNPAAATNEMHTYKCTGNGEVLWSTETVSGVGARHSFSYGLQAMRHTTGTAQNFHDMFVWGGGDSTTAYSATGFNITSPNGKNMTFGAAVSTLNAPSGRAGHAVLTSFIPELTVADNKYYVIFGISSTFTYPNDIKMYNANTDTWTTLASP